jgi:hypothetical protein
VPDGEDEHDSDIPDSALSRASFRYKATILVAAPAIFTAQRPPPGIILREDEKKMKAAPFS